MRSRARDRRDDVRVRSHFEFEHSMKEKAERRNPTFNDCALCCAAVLGTVIVALAVTRRLTVAAKK